MPMQHARTHGYAEHPVDQEEEERLKNVFETIFVTTRYHDRKIR